jgi:hypothetical protein
MALLRPSPLLKEDSVTLFHYYLLALEVASRRLIEGEISGFPIGSTESKRLLHTINLPSI